ncbi:MAG: acetylornithine carbamoyltransferase [Saprospiraceae bacterium]|nr:acetylornithine carbamoyltransferase [Saprospiraceae bacterium]
MALSTFTSFADVDHLDNWVELAKKIKDNPFQFQDWGRNKTLGLIFLNPSLRTRLSTQKAALNLGMQVMVMNMNQDGWAIEMEDGTVMNAGTQEHIKEAAGVISQYCDIIGIRTFPGLKDRGEDYAENIMNKFLAHATVPVVSLESATRHPLQSFADVLTIEETKNKSKPKVVLSWAPHPRALPQAVSNSFVEWMIGARANLVITNPEGWDLSKNFTRDTPVLHNQEEALQGADFVYTKNWSSFENYGAIATGKENWMITKAKLSHTNEAKFMHCLPVRRNVVVADEVLDSPASLVLEQANNRTFAAQTVLLKMLGYEG